MNILPLTTLPSLALLAFTWFVMHLSMEATALSPYPYEQEPRSGPVWQTPDDGSEDRFNPRAALGHRVETYRYPTSWEPEPSEDSRFMLGHHRSLSDLRMASQQRRLTRSLGREGRPPKLPSPRDRSSLSNKDTSRENTPRETSPKDDSTKDQSLKDQSLRDSAGEQSFENRNLQEVSRTASSLHASSVQDTSLLDVPVNPLFRAKRGEVRIPSNPPSSSGANGDRVRIRNRLGILTESKLLRFDSERDWVKKSRPGTLTALNLLQTRGGDAHLHETMNTSPERSKSLTNSMASPESAKHYRMPMRSLSKLEGPPTIVESKSKLSRTATSSSKPPTSGRRVPLGFSTPTHQHSYSGRSHTHASPESVVRVAQWQQRASDELQREWNKREAALHDALHATWKRGSLAIRPLFGSAEAFGLAVRKKAEREGFTRHTFAFWSKEQIEEARKRLEVRRSLTSTEAMKSVSVDRALRRWLEQVRPDAKPVGRWSLSMGRVG